MKFIKDVIEFDWDEGNIGKNKKHDVSDKEAEEVFFDKKRFIFTDEIHSHQKESLRIIGKTKKGKRLFVVFTRRKGKIRIISARGTNKKEVVLYEKKVGSA